MPYVQTIKLETRTGSVYTLDFDLNTVCRESAHNLIGMSSGDWIPDTTLHVQGFVEVRNLEVGKGADILTDDGWLQTTSVVNMTCTIGYFEDDNA